MRQKMFLFSLLFALSAFSQSRLTMAQAFPPGLGFKIAGPVAIGESEKLEIIFTKLKQPSIDNPLTIEPQFSPYMMVTTVTNPYAGDELCSVRVPVEVEIKPGTTAIKIERSEGELKVNGASATTLPSCLRSGRVVVMLDLPLSRDDSDYISDLSKVPALVNKLGLRGVIVNASILRTDDTTETTSKWEGTFLSVHNLHVSTWD